MRLPAIVLAVGLLGCRRDPPAAPPRRVSRAAPARPDAVVGTVEVGSLRALTAEVGALLGLDAPPAATAGELFGLEPSRLAAADLGAPALVALTAEGAVVSLAAQDPAGVEARLAGRWRLVEEAELGAWIVAAEDTGASSACALLSTEGASRIVCGRSRAVVRVAGPWLVARRAAVEGSALRASITDAAWRGAWAPVLGQVVRGAADWLDAQAASARAARGAPDFGDPEPIVAALRSGSNDLVEGARSLRDLSLDLSVEGDAIRLRLRAGVGGDAEGALATLARWGSARRGGVAYALPARGAAIGLRAPPELARRGWLSAAALYRDVQGPRLTDRSGYERSVRALAEQLSGDADASVWFGRERSSFRASVGLRDEAAARRAWSAPGRAPAAPGGVTVAIDGGALQVRRGEPGEGAVTRVDDALAALGVRMSEGAAGTLEAVLRTDRAEPVGLVAELRVGRAWLRAARSFAEPSRDR